MKVLSNNTPIVGADFAHLVLTPEKLNRKHGEVFAALSFFPMKEEFSFICVQFQFIH